MMQRIERERAKRYAFDPGYETLLTVDQGEVFEVETEDAASGRVREDGFVPSVANRQELRGTPPLVNPVAGPIEVRGAGAGDVLAVTIHDIEPEDQGWTGVRRGAGPLGDSIQWMGEAAEAHATIIRHTPGADGKVKHGTAHFEGKYSWPVTPFIGTLATAPEREVTTSGLGQGAYGGNLDVREYREGATVLLNSYHDGARVFVGDVHGSQADTEFTGTANEVRSTVRLSCAVAGSERLPAPRIIKDETIVFLGIEKPLEQAVVKAITHWMGWLVAEHGVSRRDAYLLSSVHPAMRVHVYQMVPGFGLDYVAGVEFPKDGP